MLLQRNVSVLFEVEALLRQSQKLDRFLVVDRLLSLRVARELMLLQLFCD